MKILDLHEQALKTETACLEFLRTFGIFSNAAAICPGRKVSQCLNPMKTIHRKNRKGHTTSSWRCSKKNCRIQRSIRSTNKFFAFQDSRGRTKCNLNLRQILLLVYLFVYSNDTLDQIVIKTGHSKATVCDWMNLCREVCSRVVRSLPKMVGTNDKPVQIDESYFQGRRKYNRGRLRDGDKAKDDEAEKKEEMKRDKNSDYEHGKVVGPWVFGLYMSQTRCRFYVVHDRTGDTLLPLVHDNVEPGSTVVSDLWPAYNRLKDEGYTHETVNHSKNFVNPLTGFHTQAIERVWKEGKKWIQRARHAGPYLQNHLDEVSWRAYRRDHPNGLLGAFLEDVHHHYSVGIECLKFKTHYK